MTISEKSWARLMTRTQRKAKADGEHLFVTAHAWEQCGTHGWIYTAVRKPRSAQGALGEQLRKAGEHAAQAMVPHLAQLNEQLRTSLSQLNAQPTRTRRGNS